MVKIGNENAIHGIVLQGPTTERRYVNPDEILVGSLALVFAVVSFLIGVGPWSAPYQLRTIQAVAKRYGKTAARVVWVVISLAFLVVGMAVLLGLRPSYANLSEDRYGVRGACRSTSLVIGDASFSLTHSM